MDWSNPPPANYVCNRCGLKGHHLKFCPTNMDPSYDKAPGDDYRCAICGEYEAHYVSLCPQNMDVGSITQRRLAQGIVWLPGAGHIDEKNDMLEQSKDFGFKRARSEESEESVPKKQYLGKPQVFDMASLNVKDSSYEFVIGLAQRHPEFSEVVNVQKQRLTALDMWEQKDQRRCVADDFENVTGNPETIPRNSTIFSGCSEVDWRNKKRAEKQDGKYMAGRLTPYGSPSPDPSEADDNLNASQGGEPRKEQPSMLPETSLTWPR